MAEVSQQGGRRTTLPAEYEGASEAAHKLWEQVHRKPWFAGVGVGQKDGLPCVYLYMKWEDGKEVSFLDGGWLGQPVEVVVSWPFVCMAPPC